MTTFLWILAIWLALQIPLGILVGKYLKKSQRCCYGNFPPDRISDRRRQ